MLAPRTRVAIQVGPPLIWIKSGAASKPNLLIKDRSQKSLPSHG
jgi:hypothetical protein